MAPENIFSLKGRRVWVAGETGLVGSALVHRLVREGCDILSAPHSALDLTRQADTEKWMDKNRPDVVFLAAARVGGIRANSDYPADFLGENLSIAQNVIGAAHKASVKKLVYLGSSCIYPRDATQPVTEDALLSGPLEETNQWYAVAKIAGLKLCQAYRAQYGCDFIAAMPTNLYGPGDTFDEKSSHVIPALMLKMHSAKVAKVPTVTVWGTGAPLREFLHVDDLADALVVLSQRYSSSVPVNIGSGQEISIADLARMIKETVGYKGNIVFDPSMPDGTPRKRLNTGKLDALGWKPQTGLAEGLEKTYAWFCETESRSPMKRSATASG